MIVENFTACNCSIVKIVIRIVLIRNSYFDVGNAGLYVKKITYYFGQRSANQSTIITF